MAKQRLTDGTFGKHYIDPDTYSVDHIPSDFGHWLAGLTDGDGSFIIYLRQHPSSHGRINPQTRLHIGLRDDDGEVIRYIQQTLQIGRVYHSDLSTQRKQGHNVRDKYDFIVTDKGGCLFMVKFFERFPLRSKKKKAFKIWREAVLEWCKGPNMNLDKFTKLRKEILQVRKYKGPR